jgi:sulfur carrier protein
MKIIVNHLEQELIYAMHLQELMNLIQPKKPFAISLNGQFVPKEKYTKTLLAANDQIQIIVPVTGG